MKPKPQRIRNVTKMKKRATTRYVLDMSSNRVRSCHVADGGSYRPTKRMKKMNKISPVSLVDNVEDSEIGSVYLDVVDFHSSLITLMSDPVSSSLGCWKFGRLG
jgi:hypothetical protein